MASNHNALLLMKNIKKAFPGVLALDEVQFELRKGEVHALIGENGAGKSTLIKILAGVYQLDDGHVFLDDKEIHIEDPHDAQRRGIFTIFQELSTVPNLSITENMFLGREIVKKAFIDRKRQVADTKKLLKSYNYHIDPNRIVGELSVAQQKMISIIKAMNNELKILILDEPTASLADLESEILFENIRMVREQGISIIYISHRLDELKKIGDRVTVLRNGKYVDTLRLNDVKSIDDLTPLMIGKEIKNKFPKVKGTITEPLLRVHNLTRKNHFYDINFEVKSGEILGFFGLIGCGFEEVLRSVFGAHTYDSGTVEVYEDDDFRPVESYNPKSALDLKVSYIPSDRKHEGLIMPLSVKENITIASFDKFSAKGLGWIDRHKISSEANRFIDLLGIKVADPNFKVETLSGGNQQKVIIAKALCRGGNIFLFSEPTVGIDVGTKVEIYRFMNKLIARGAAIVLVSYELPEIMAMSDRIIVMYNGRIMKKFDRQEAIEDKILKYAFGEGVKAEGRSLTV